MSGTKTTTTEAATSSQRAAAPIGENAGILDPLLDAIASGNGAEVDRWIALLPLDDLDPSVIYTLLGQLLSATEELGMIRRVLEAFAESNPTEDKISTFSMLFIYPQIPVDLLGVVSRAFPENTHDEVAIELMKYDNKPILGLAMERLSQVYGERSYLEADLLYQQASSEDTNATEIADYFFNLMGEQAPFAEVPPWVLPPATGKMPTLRALTIEAERLSRAMTSPPSSPRSARAPKLTPSQIADQLTAGLANAGVSIEDVEMAREVMRSQIAVATPADRAAFLAPLGIIERRADGGESNRRLFQIVGPVNMLNDAVLLGEDVCARFGGCRMLTCNCFERSPEREGISYHSLLGEDAEEYDFQTADWFLQQRCQTCANRIRCRAHAIRRPLVMGGWLGCYCSRTCLVDSLSKDELLNGISRELVRRVLEQIEAIGILDRENDRRRPDDEIDTAGAAAQTAILSQRPGSPTRAGAAASAPLPKTDLIIEWEEPSNGGGLDWL